ncbi:protein EPIDERMAL PATTERNING FACTOR 1-like isoform X2 [Salvia hispanica]|uniref:protein EPIDERMAL PATTERNING FACTOR 1-like isoform X2 n=1 Tax=Salvia hispanica TaxID=49212 RepID=UPI0020094A9D|nr:protein EPIDERMAL PATTERNING FACTOR 1-like isoform X2 [Salvia hispanica]
MDEMKKGSTLVLLVLIVLLVTIHARPHHGRQTQSHYRVVPNLLKHKQADTLQVAGSRLPDCTHACGSCTPCRLVMVSFVCSSIEEAETCPMAYKCMCHNKSYPVP